MAIPRLIEGVLELLRDLSPDDRKVLDVSCKKGEIASELKALGFSVRGTNFSDVAEKLDGIEVDQGVDLLKGLPYADSSFDVVLLVEVIEHLENHRVAIGELARVLKPGGVLILTTPNVMRLNSRLHFLLTGYHKTKRRFIRFETPLARAHEFHNYPIELPILYYLLKQQGLEIERLGGCRIKLFSWFLFVLLTPIVAAYTWFFLAVREKDPHQRAHNARLFRWLLRPGMLLEDNLLLRIRKRAPGEHGVAV
jgi:2-polyprenyl-3-methyl-5-hydroxy-6-metoxy-1,4-benzoquinol methylase